MGLNRLYPANSFAVGLVAVATLLTVCRDALAQSPAPATRIETLEATQADKAKSLTPQEPRRAERLMGRVNAALTRGGPHWYPFFQNSYSGGGFPFGAGYSWFVS